ncbi:protein decapentaplegic-like [Venturia canescens]|uniref:protein decapentaplegic-like n=1 Tax=Venturia canescens TaxID=32260 RepID=UPI001C9CC048|nr:protein decapentaplegic-like [Venturia canescens]
MLMPRAGLWLVLEFLSRGIPLKISSFEGAEWSLVQSAPAIWGCDCLFVSIRTEQSSVGSRNEYIRICYKPREKRAMVPPPQYWYVLLIGSVGICCLCWRTSITLTSPNVVAKASIEVDLSLPSPSIISHRLFNGTSKRQAARGNHHSKKRHHGPVSRFMIHLYNRRPNADIVRALKPLHVSTASIASRDAGGMILEFQIPPVRSQEDLQSAELFGALGTIVRVRAMDQRIFTDVRRSRRDDNWRAFDVTSVVNERAGDLVKLLVNGRMDLMRSRETSPILVLSYAKPKVRHSRAVQEDDHEDGAAAAAAPWIEEGGRRVRRRNLCRRRPLYVDFASIAYDEWVVAPPGYEAYQCVGKCFYPFGDHLSPTKHAIVQTLVHGALQGTDAVNGKQVGRACCVPTRLAPTSLLYIDASGTLTYQYGYEDMVVAECGCR